MDERDERILRVLQGDLPLTEQPFRQMAFAIGIGEEELLERVQVFLAEGKLQKMGAVLRQRAVGCRVNALSVWQVPEDRIEETGEAFARHPAVIHCYARVPQPDWPYTPYAMLHGGTRKECAAVAAALSATAGNAPYRLLYSTRELKKTSMCYF